MPPKYSTPTTPPIPVPSPMAHTPTLIFETVHGSRAYNLARPGSDTDIKGIIVGPPAWYFSPEPGPEQISVRGDDHVRFELRKFFRLAIAGNPTLLELLWTDPQHHLTVTPAGQRLLDARSEFLSKRVAHTFAGYAMSQLKRIRSHRRWLLKPPAAAPQRADFGLPEFRPISRDQLGAAEAIIERAESATHSNTIGIDTNFLELLAAERRYTTARNEWKQYQGWRKQRNPARAELEAKYGYDSKHAMHLVRLQRMAIEVLQTGKLQVTRSDRDQLLAIRDGALSYDALMAECDALSDQINAAAKTSPLPNKPDEARLNALCVTIIKQTLPC